MPRRSSVGGRGSVIIGRVRLPADAQTVTLVSRPNPDSRARRRGLLLLLAVLLAAAAWGYPPERHQRLTFLAAREFNRCNVDQQVEPITALQIRYVAGGAVTESESLLGKLFRWRVFTPQKEDGRILWLLETRVHRRFVRAVENYREAANSAERYKALGVIVFYLQLMTSPPHVVPVFQGRLWLGQLDDAFNRYRVDPEQVGVALGEGCPDPDVAGTLEFTELLRRTAMGTRAALRQPIADFGVDWQVFWEMNADPGEFGSYGPAGNNFGDDTDFPCDQDRCVLLQDDPIYQAFAAERHAEAVRVTALAIWAAQQRRGTVTPIQPPSEGDDTP